MSQHSGREPALPGPSDSDAPMLGGARRQWPSVAVYLMAEQHKAHREWDMERVWVMRQLRYQINEYQRELRRASLLSGRPVEKMTDADALEAMRQERAETKELLDEYAWNGENEHVARLRRMITIMDEVISYWHQRA